MRALENLQPLSPFDEQGETSSQHFFHASRLGAHTFANITVGALLVAVAVVQTRRRRVGHGLLRTVLRVVQVKHVANITEEPRRRLPGHFVAERSTGTLADLRTMKSILVGAAHVNLRGEGSFPTKINKRVRDADTSRRTHLRSTPESSDVPFV